MSSELEAQVEEESRAAWAKTNDEIKSDTVSADFSRKADTDERQADDDVTEGDNGSDNAPVDFD